MAGQRGGALSLSEPWGRPSEGGAAVTRRPSDPLSGLCRSGGGASAPPPTSPLLSPDLELTVVRAAQAADWFVIYSIVRAACFHIYGEESLNTTHGMKRFWRVPLIHGTSVSGLAPTVPTIVAGGGRMKRPVREE